MGNSQASNLRAQFETVELRESTKKQLWQVYHCTPKAGGTAATASSGAGATAGGRGNTEDSGADAGSESPLSSPRRQEPQPAASSSPAATVVMLQLNTQHASFKAASMPPKVLNPDQHVPSQYKLQYNMLDASYRALQWLRDHPHRSLLRIRSVECHSESKLLFATTTYTSIEPVVLRLPVMCATEILFGLVKVAEALAQLHSSGLAHRYVTWKSIYLAYTAQSAASSARAEAVWTLGEPQFLSSSVSAQEHNQDALKDYLSEVRGARQDPSLLPFFAPEMNNPYAASQWDWSKMPIGAGDVFGFGVMVEMVLNTDRTRFQTTSSAFYNPVASGGCSAKVALDELKLFAKACQHEDPFKRPPIEAFLDLVAVNCCTYVAIQQQLDHYRGSGLVQKVHFFYLLHAEMLKLPYDQLVTRVMPRLLKSSIWSEPCAEPFIRQLLVPLHGGTKAVGSVVTAASDVPPEEMLVLPLSNDVRELLSLPAGDEWHLTPGATSPSNTKPGAKVEAAPPLPNPAATARVPQLPCVGLLQLSDFQLLVGAFLKKTMERIVLSKSPRPSPQPEPLGTSDLRAAELHTAVGTAASPQLLCVLLRNVESYVAAVSFASVVIPCIVPFVSHCLRHSDADVVMEALRSFTVVHRFVMHAYERLHGNAPLRRGAAATASTVDQEAPDVLQMAVGAGGANAASASADNAKLVLAAVANARTLLLGVLATDIFSLACTDLVADIRLSALTTSIRSLSNPASSWKWMPRDRAMAALCCNVMLVRADGGGRGGDVRAMAPLRLPDAAAPIAITPTSTPLIQISLRAMKFIEKILPGLTPSEVVQGVVPSVVNVIDRCTITKLRRPPPPAVGGDAGSGGEPSADGGSIAGPWKLLEDLHGCAVGLLTRLYEHLHNADARSPNNSGNTGGGSPPPEGGEDDDADPVDVLSSSTSSQGTVGRHAVVVDADGWCAVRDPTPFEPVSVKTYISTMPYRRSAPSLAASTTARSARQRPSAPSTATARVDDNIASSVHDGAGEDGEAPPQVGKWSGLSLPLDMVRSLPLYSFVDCDHEFNTAAIVRPDCVAAEIISAASTTRTFVASIKPHVLASRLPSRRPASLAPTALDDGQQLLASGGTAKRTSTRSGRASSVHNNSTNKSSNPSGSSPMESQPPADASRPGSLKAKPSAGAAARRTAPMALEQFENSLSDAQQHVTDAKLDDVDVEAGNAPTAQGPPPPDNVEDDVRQESINTEGPIGYTNEAKAMQGDEAVTTGAESSITREESGGPQQRQPASIGVVQSASDLADTGRAHEDDDDYRAPSSDPMPSPPGAETHAPTPEHSTSLTDSFGAASHLTSGSRQRSGGGSFKGQHKPSNQPVPRRKKGGAPQLSTSPNAVPKLLNDDDL